jgi:hypothetical protein
MVNSHFFRKIINEWKKKRIGDIHFQDEVCKKIIAWIDKQSEIRRFGGTSAKNSEESFQTNCND